MFCTQCGKSNPEGNRFCAGCGAALKLTSPKSVQQPLKPFTLILGGSVIVVLIVLLIASLRGGEGKPPQPTRTEQPPPPRVAELTPVLQVNPSSLEFALREGEKTPQAQMVTVTNVGKGRLEWQAQTDAPWLRLNRNNGVLTEGKSAQIAVSIDASSLQTLTRQEARIVVTAPKANGSPTAVKVIANPNRNVDPQLRGGIEIPLRLLDYIGVENVNYEQTTLGTVFRAQRGKYVMLVDFGYSFNRYQPLEELIAQGVEIVFLAKDLMNIDEKEERSVLASRVYFGGYLLDIRGGTIALIYVEPDAASIKVLDVVDYHSIEKDVKAWVAQVIGGTPLGNAAPALSMRDRLEYLFNSQANLKPVFPDFDHRRRLIYAALSKEILDYNEQVIVFLLEGTRYSRRIRDLKEGLKSSNEFDRRRLQSQLDNLVNYLKDWLKAELFRTITALAEGRYYWSKTEAEFGEYDFTAGGFPFTRVWGLGVNFTPEFNQNLPGFLPIHEELAQQLAQRRKRVIEYWIIWQPIRIGAGKTINPRGNTQDRPTIVSEPKEAFAFDKPTGLLMRLSRR
jgi:hypothetical protein